MASRLASTSQLLPCRLQSCSGALVRSSGSIQIEFVSPDHAQYQLTHRRGRLLGHSSFGEYPVQYSIQPGSPPGTRRHSGCVIGARPTPFTTRPNASPEIIHLRYSRWPSPPIRRRTASILAATSPGTQNPLARLADHPARGSWILVLAVIAAPADSCSSSS